MALERVGSTLARVLADAGLAGALRGWQAVDLWAGVVGEKAARRSRAVAFEAGRLIVEVDAPVWSRELAFMKREILAQLNRALGEGIIQDIQFTPSRGGRP